MRPPVQAYVVGPYTFTREMPPGEPERWGWRFYGSRSAVATGPLFATIEEAMEDALRVATQDGRHP